MKNKIGLLLLFSICFIAIHGGVRHAGTLSYSLEPENFKSDDERKSLEMAFAQAQNLIRGESCSSDPALQLFINQNNDDIWNDTELRHLANETITKVIQSPVYQRYVTLQDHNDGELMDDFDDLIDDCLVQAEQELRKRTYTNKFERQKTALNFELLCMSLTSKYNFKLYSFHSLCPVFYYLIVLEDGDSH